MSSIYVKNRSNISPFQLTNEINEHVGITKQCEHVTLNGSSEIVLSFDQNLTSEEETVLNSIITAHAIVPPVPLIVDAYQIVGIGGVKSEPMAFSPDATRGNKMLSSESFTIIFSENMVNHMDWIQVGIASDADSGFIMPFPGTIVRATGHCEDTKSNTMNFHLYINSGSIGSLFAISGNNEQSASALDLNYDFEAGDKLRLRGIGSGKIEDTVIVLWIKWRKA